MKAVQFDRYGDVSVLDVRDVPRPEASAGRVLVRVRAAAINPGEAKIREGAMAKQWPSTFPSGEGSDLAGIVEAVGDGVTRFAVGDEVFGYSDERSSHAEYVAVPEDQLVPKPEALSWEQAGSIFVAPLAGYAGVPATGVKAGDTVVVSAAAGGAGGTAAQYAKHLGATVIGLAGEANQEWLASRGITPVVYGEGQADRIRAAAPGGVDALIDTFGGGYTDLGIELGVDPSRINTIIDFPAVERLGVSAQGSSQVVSPDTLTEIAGLVADGTIELPIAATYPLEQVRDAFNELAQGHTRGKIVLIP